MSVVGFDIDGYLTTDEGMGTYERWASQPGAVVGIVTSRPPPMKQAFVRKHNLEPDFAFSAPVKGPVLLGLKQVYDGPYIYYGSWAKDRIDAAVAGWEYRTENHPNG